MARIIYSKYCTERDKRFAISTSILQDKTGRYVEKRPLFPEGKAHIKALTTFQRKLESLFKDSPLQIQPVQRFSEDACIFAYIEGQTLEQKINELLDQGGYEAAVSEIDRYFAMLRSACSGQAFKMTSEFKRIFGDETFSNDERCATINDIDYGFGNIVLSKDGMVLIDYEWCFEIPIPIDFILFRALLYYVYSSPKSDELLGRGIFARFGYSDADIEKYGRMEDRFQKYISGDGVSIADLKDTMLKKTLNIHQMFAEHSVQDKNKAVQVYYDTGEGFSGDHSYWSEISRDAENIVVGIRGIPDGVLRVRFDVRKERCLLNILSIRDEDDRDLRDYCDINGTPLGRGVYVCDVPDPWVVVKRDGFHDLKLVFDVLEVSDGSLMKALQSETAACGDKIKALNGTIEQKENYIGEQPEMLSEKFQELDRLGKAVRDALSGMEDAEIPEVDSLCGFLSKGLIRKLFRAYVYAKRRKGHAT